MADIEYRPIDPDRLAAMRAKGADEFGNVWAPYRPPAGNRCAAACARRIRPSRSS
jgi:hypothetical protein